nr:thialysine N-epsilon-acetyltransferase-like [Lytechinus pictus]
MGTYTIRKAEPDDCDDIVRLINELAEYENMPDQVDVTPEKLRADAFCDQPFVNLLVAVCTKSNTTVAYSSFSYTYSSWKGRTVYLDDLYVTPAHRGHGIGTTLMQSVARCAYEQKQCNRMNWIVLAWNERPKEMYARLGGENLTVKESWENITLFKEQLKNLATTYQVKLSADTTIDVQL